MSGYAMSSFLQGVEKVHLKRAKPMIKNLRNISNDSFIIFNKVIDSFVHVTDLNLIQLRLFW